MIGTWQDFRGHIWCDAPDCDAEIWTTAYYEADEEAMDEVQDMALDCGWEIGSLADEDDRTFCPRHRHLLDVRQPHKNVQTLDTEESSGT